MNLNRPPQDRHNWLLMRAKDYLIIAGILFSWLTGIAVSMVWGVRFVDRVNKMEAEITELRIQVVQLKTRDDEE